jgi:hypothetical protein
MKNAVRDLRSLTSHVLALSCSLQPSARRTVRVNAAGQSKSFALVANRFIARLA